MDVGHQYQIDPGDPWSVAEKKQNYRRAVWTIRQPMASEADQYHSSKLSQAESLKLADERASKIPKVHRFGGVSSMTTHGLRSGWVLQWMLIPRVICKFA